jgi:lysophospholipase L1-like esterase
MVVIKSCPRIILFVSLSLVVVTISCSLSRNAAWVGTWSASPAPPLSGALEFQDETVREIVHVSVGGSAVRVILSNLYGTETLAIGEAHIALSNSGSSIVSGSDQTLTFGGLQSCSISPGAFLVSDSLKMNFSAATSLAISLYLPTQVSNPTVHPIGLETTYISQGNHANDSELAANSTISSWPFLTGVEVNSTETTTSIVALGDSITDGFNSTLDLNHRWTDVLSNRLNVPNGSGKAVLNAGLSGNRILHDAPGADLAFGSDALNRFGRDVLSQAGVKYVIVLEGINDMGLPGYLVPESEQVMASQIIAGLQQLIQQSHSRGLKIYGGTLTPFENSETAFPGYYTLGKEVEREMVNAWIRDVNSFDAVIDFDQVLRDPTHPTKLLPQYDSGDHLHPNDAGYAAMGGAIDLQLFR